MWLLPIWAEGFIWLLPFWAENFMWPLLIWAEGFMWLLSISTEGILFIFQLQLDNINIARARRKVERFSQNVSFFKIKNIHFVYHHLSSMRFTVWLSTYCFLLKQKIVYIMFYISHMYKRVNVQVLKTIHCKWRRFHVLLKHLPWKHNQNEYCSSFMALFICSLL